MTDSDLCIELLPFELGNGESSPTIRRKIAGLAEHAREFAGVAARLRHLGFR